MKNRVSILVIFFVLSIPQIARANWGFTIGADYSYLKNPSYSRPSVAAIYGMTKNWPINDALGLEIGFLFANAKTTLQDKSILNFYPLHAYPYLPVELSEIYFYDIHINLHFLEMPLLLQVNKALRKNLAIGLEVGGSIRFHVRDTSSAVVLKKVKVANLTAEERKDFRFDYRVTNEDENHSYSGRGVCPILGIHIVYSRLKLELRYQIDSIHWVSGIFMGGNLPFYSASALIGYQFN